MAWNFEEDYLHKFIEKIFLVLSPFASFDASIYEFQSCSSLPINNNDITNIAKDIALTTNINNYVPSQHSYKPTKPSQTTVNPIFYLKIFLWDK